LTIAARISKRLVLIDGAELARLMVRTNIGDRAEQPREARPADQRRDPAGPEGRLADQNRTRIWARENDLPAILNS
jgi:hypothetical protein